MTTECNAIIHRPHDAVEQMIDRTESWTEVYAARLARDIQFEDEALGNSSESQDGDMASVGPCSIVRPSAESYEIRQDDMLRHGSSVGYLRTDDDTAEAAGAILASMADDSLGTGAGLWNGNNVSDPVAVQDWSTPGQALEPFLDFDSIERGLGDDWVAMIDQLLVNHDPWSNAAAG